MLTPLESKFDSFSKRFRKKVEKDLISLAPFSVTFNIRGEKIEKVFKKSTLTNALNTACPKPGSVNHNLQVKNLVDLLESISFEVSLSSSPTAFRRSWNAHSNTLSQAEIDAIATDGGQLIPAQPEHSHRIFRKPSQESGLILFPTNKKGQILRAVRHVSGNYIDELSVFGELAYQTDKSATGILQYRFIEELSRELEVNLPLQLVTYFKTPDPDSNSDLKNDPNRISHFFITTFASINFSDQLKWNTNWFKLPLKLQIEPISEIRKTIGYIKSLTTAETMFKVRPPLRSDIENDWSYEKISSNSNARGKAIRLFAQSINLSCGDGISGKNECKKTLDQCTSLSEIHLGHIVPQNWAKAYQFLSDSSSNVINHPDNLYLSCGKCNRTLNDNFPSDKARKRIEKNGWTVGDLLRKHENRILQFIPSNQ